MRIAVTGASGLIGSALSASLAGSGHEVLTLARSRAAGPPGTVYWDPAKGEIDAASLDGVDGVVHLAGESISGGRWTEKRKEAILKSRTDGTRLLSQTIAKLRKAPRVLVSASAVGYYGHRGEEEVTEAAPRGSGFLSEVCEAWEGAADPAREAGIRVAHPRIGIALSRSGGALPKMLTPFRFGLGGPIGNGRQSMSWIALEDLVRVLAFLLIRDDMAGPVNAVAPHPVTSGEFAGTLGRTLGRPAVLPLPAFAVGALFGEMGRALLLEGARVIPSRLQAAGFEYRFPRLEGALRAELISEEIPPAPL